MPEPTKEELIRYGYQQALSEQDQEGQKSGTQQLIRGIEETKKQIQKSLLGYHYEKRRDDNGDIVTVKVEHHDQEKLCNEKAVADIMATVEGTVNINTLGSNLSTKNISDLGQDATASLIQLVFENREKYGIESTAVARQILGVVSTNLMAALTKAKNGRFLDYDSTITSVKEIKTETGEKDRKIL